MPVDPASPLAASSAAFAPVLMPVQAVLFLLLLVAVSVCDLKRREIPDGLQMAIAALTLLCFSPINLWGVLGALPYLIIALFFGGGDGMGGGDIKLAAATGVVLGLPASLTASILGLGLMSVVCGLITGRRRFHGRREKTAYPAGPFLAVGAAAAYFMKIGGLIL